MESFRYESTSTVRLHNAAMSLYFNDVRDVCNCCTGRFQCGLIFDNATKLDDSVRYTYCCEPRAGAPYVHKRFDHLEADDIIVTVHGFVCTIWSFRQGLNDVRPTHNADKLSVTVRNQPRPATPGSACAVAASLGSSAEKACGAIRIRAGVEWTVYTERV